MNKSETIGALALALSKAQSQITGAVKDSLNPHFAKSYADLSSVWDACRGPLSANELSVVQTIDISESGLIVETTLLHSSGEWITGRLKIAPAKPDPQGIGSCITYARRYTLSAMVGVAPLDDDDGEPDSRPAKKSAAKPVIKSKVILDTIESLRTRKELESYWYSLAKDVREIYHAELKVAFLEADKNDSQATQ